MSPAFLPPTHAQHMQPSKKCTFLSRRSELSFHLFSPKVAPSSALCPRAKAFEIQASIAANCTLPVAEKDCREYSSIPQRRESSCPLKR